MSERADVRVPADNAAQSLLGADRRRGGRWRSRVYAVKSLMSLGVGAIAVQVSGRLHDLTGSFDALFMVMTGSAAIVILGATFLLPTHLPEPVAVPAEQWAG